MDINEFNQLYKSPAKELTTSPTKYIKVQFDDGRCYSYFSKFDIKLGDVVFVAGKMDGKPGVVVGLSSKLPSGKVMQNTLSVVKAYNIQNNINNIDYNMFETIEIIDDVLTKCVLNKDVDTLVIPKNVKKIGNISFEWQHYKCKRIDFPEGLVEIGDRAFDQCTSLESVVFPNTLTKIGSAFFLCWEITEIIIPKSIETIGDYAFSMCGFKKVIFEGDEIVLGKNVFRDCSNLNQIICSSKIFNQLSPKIKFNTSLYFLNHKELYNDKEAIQYLEYLKKQKKKFFKHIIENNEEVALTEFLKLNYVTLEMLDEVLNNPSNYNTQIVSILLDYSNSNFSNKEKEERIQKDLIKALNEPTVTDLKKIWRFKTNKKGEVIISGFKGNEINVVVPNKIGENHVVEIGEEAFAPYGRMVRNYSQRIKVKSVEILEGVRRIKSDAFRGSNLMSIALPESITSIDEGAFAHSNITSISIPKKVKIIKSSTFLDCEQLQSVKMPNGLKTISDEAFSNCTSLKNVVIPNKVTCIGNAAFVCCESLTNIIIPNSVMSIGNLAFDGCKNLTSITILNNSTSLGKHVFWGCKNLTIRCHAGSYVEEYAKEHKIKCELIDD